MGSDSEANLRREAPGRPVRAAIIGTGGIARAHVEALRNENERTEIVAAVDTEPYRAEAFCRAHEIPGGYTGAEEMLAAARPDLVHICTPPATHCELAVLSLEAGAWVLCEKPLCGSLAQLDLIEAAEERTGRYCASVFQWRFGSGARHLKSIVEAQAAGRPLVGICNTTWFRGQGYYDVPWRGRWMTELGGVSMGHGIHAMDLFLWLLGDWREVRARMGTLDRDMEVEDVSMALVDFENGAMGSVVNSVLSPREESYLRLDFQKATAELRHLYGYSNKNWSFTAPDHNVLDRCQKIPTDVPSSHAAQLSNLLDDMSRNERPSTSGPGARRTIEFLSGLYKSALSGEPVQRGSIDRDDPFYHRMCGPNLREERTA